MTAAWQVGDQLLQLLARAGQGDDAAAQGRQCFGRGRADALGGPADQGGFVAEIGVNKRLL